MKTRKLFLFAALLGLMSTGRVAAQDAPKNDPPAAVAIDDSLGHALGLTNEQMKLVQEADERYRESVSKGDKSALDKRDRDLKAILLPSQYTEWQAIVSKRRKAG